MRKKLLSSGQARKYLLYAIGEIALVVIGILIALQINNWNERRKEAQLAGQYLLEIYRDIESLAAQLDEVALQLQKESQAAEYILETMDAPGHEIVDSLSMYQAFTEVGMQRIVINGNKVYQELSRSGQLGAVGDRQLLTRLNVFNTEYEKIASAYNQQAVQMKLDLQKYWSADTLLEEWKSERKTGENHINQIARLLKSQYFYQLLMQNMISADGTLRHIVGLRDLAGLVLRDLEVAYPEIIKSFP